MEDTKDPTTDNSMQEQAETAEQVGPEQSTTGAEAPQESSSNKPDEVEIPAELQGVSKEAAIEAMNKYREQQSQDENVEADNVNKQSEYVPYQRFKQINDKYKATQDELTALKQQLQQQAQSQVQQPKPQAQPQTIPQPAAVNFQITPEVSKAIDDLAKREAMATLNLSQDDLDSLAYADDNDAQKQKYDEAYNVAKNNVIANVQAEVARKNDEQLREAQEAANNFKYLQDFVAEQRKDSDFIAITKYGENDFFNAQEPIVQQAIAQAITRIDHQAATPQDVTLIKQYYQAASKSYKDKQSVTAQKVQNMKKQPKAVQLDGAADNTADAITVENLQHMLATQPWDTIPDKAKEALKRGYI